MICDTLIKDFKVKTETIETTCEKHNIPAQLVKYIISNYTHTINKCPLCQEEKQEEQKIQDAEKRKQQSISHKQAQIEKHTANAKIHNSYAHATLQNFESNRQPHIYPMYLKYATYIDHHIKYGINIFARGATGRGKTHLAVSVAKVALKKGYTVLFETLLAIQLSLEDRTQKIHEVLKIYYEVDLLIIDELVAIKYERTKQLIDEILEYRYSRRKAVIINTHLPMSVLATILDETRRSRLKENSLQKPFVDFDLYYKESDQDVTKPKYDYRNLKNVRF